LLTLCTAGGVANSAVDIFDANSRLWSTAVLSEALIFRSAASLPNQGLAIIAGGSDGS
jgi:hypothetical protein